VTNAPTISKCPAVAQFKMTSKTIGKSRHARQEVRLWSSTGKPYQFMEVGKDEFAVDCTLPGRNAITGSLAESAGANRVDLSDRKHGGILILASAFRVSRPKPRP
jgi:hypothetical protein